MTTNYTFSYPFIAAIISCTPKPMTLRCVAAFPREVHFTPRRIVPITLPARRQPTKTRRAIKATHRNRTLGKPSQRKVESCWESILAVLVRGMLAASSSSSSSVSLDELDVYIRSPDLQQQRPPFPSQQMSRRHTCIAQYTASQASTVLLLLQPREEVFLLSQIQTCDRINFL